MKQEAGRLAKDAGLALFFASALFFTTLVPLKLYPLGSLGTVIFAAGFVLNMLALGAIATKMPKRFTISVACIYLLFLYFATLSKYFSSVALHGLLLTFPLAWLTYMSGMKANEVWKELRVHRKNLVLLAALGVVSTIFVLYPIVIAEGLLLRFIGVQDAGKVSEVIMEAPFWLAMFSFLVAPFSEEIFFRAFLYGRLKALGKRVLPSWAAVAAAVFVTTVMFAFAHISYGSVSEIVGAFTIGLIFMLVFILTDSLVAVIAAHAVFNFISICVIYLANYFGTEIPVGLLP